MYMKTSYQISAQSRNRGSTRLEAHGSRPPPSINIRDAIILFDSICIVNAKFANGFGCGLSERFVPSNIQSIIVDSFLDPPKRTFTSKNDLTPDFEEYPCAARLLFMNLCFTKAEPLLRASTRDGDPCFYLFHQGTLDLVGSVLLQDFLVSVPKVCSELSV